MADYIIGIDQSTQSTKVFLYDQHGKMVAKANRKHRQIINEKGWISHDLDEIYTNLLTCVNELVKKVTIDLHDIKAIGITNQRETVAAWSRKTGKPLSQTVAWQDDRSQQICEQIQANSSADAELIKHKSGIPLSPYFPAAKMAWLLNNDANVQTALKAHDLCLGTIDSWLLYQLTGRATFATEPSNACRTELMDLESLQWDPELLRVFDIPVETLPQIKASDTNFGSTDFNGILPEKVAIHAVLGDSEGALFGQGGIKEGTLKATYGTGSSIMANVGSQLVRSSAGLVSSIGWQQGDHVTYVLEGNVNYTGALITWLKDSLELISDPGETEALARKANKNDQTVVVPAFTGLSAPYWVNNAQATILNMSPSTKRAEIVKASLEAIAFQIEAVIASLKQDVGQISTSTRLFVDGGPTHNKFLMQCQSDFSDVEIAVPNNEDMSAFGAVLMAGNAVGLYDAVDSAEYIDYQTYHPEITTQERQIKQMAWNKAIQTVSYHAEAPSEKLGV